jgi:hypothetical protein
VETRPPEVRLGYRAEDQVLTLSLPLHPRSTFYRLGLGRRIALHELSKGPRNLVLSALISLLFSIAALGQTGGLESLPSLPSPPENIPTITAAQFDVSALAPGTFGEDSGQSIQEEPREPRGVIKPAVMRTLEDQVGLHKAPFEPHNFKWDGFVLGGTALFRRRPPYRKRPAGRTLPVLSGHFEHRDRRVSRDPGWSVAVWREG